MIQRESPAAENRRPDAPVRTCIGCRKRELAVDLLRIVAVPMEGGQFAATVDTSGSHPGRGAWLHPDPHCLTAAIRRRAFARALRIAGPPETSAVVGHLEALHGGLGGPAARQQTGSEKHEHTVKSR